MTSQAAEPQRHILIAGPGRSGTTLLVELLDRLDFDTGADGLDYYEGANAGLETDLARLENSEASQVVKNPNLCWRLREMLDGGQLDPERVEWLLVPLRVLDAATASRVKNTIDRGNVRAPGGLIGTNRPQKLRAHLAEITYGLFETAGLYELSLIVLEYPRFATDSRYAFRRLQPILGGRTENEFEAAWQEVVDPKLPNESVEVPRFIASKLVVKRLRRWIGLKARVFAKWVRLGLVQFGVLKH